MQVTIILPDIGRGGPGLKKRVVSEQELETGYRDESGSCFQCPKCGKKASLQDKASFRKHLTYHTHKEKNYLYQCPKCPNIFCDPSNLKRHIQSIHEKQLFRCLHCDFEDCRKRRLEEHLVAAHSDKVGGEEELSLDREEEPLAFPEGGAQDSSSFLSPKRSSPNILQVNRSPAPAPAISSLAALQLPVHWV